MIHCLNQHITTEPAVSSLRVSRFEDVTAMPSGFMQFNEVDSDVKDQPFDIVEPPGEVKSDDHPQNDRPKPKRPLSAYNWFFHSERQNILTDAPIRKEGKPKRSHGKIGFADLARSIAAKWRSLSKEDRVIFDEQAAIDKQRYVREMEEWKKWQSIVVSQQSAPNVDVYRGPTSFVREPFETNSESRLSLFFQNSVDYAPPPEIVLRNEMKMSSRDFSTASYSLADVFGAQLSQRRQQSTSQNASPVEAILFPERRTSPNIGVLAQQLGDESTVLFLDLFRDS